MAFDRLGAVVVLRQLRDDEQVIAVAVELGALMGAQRRRDADALEIEHVLEGVHLGIRRVGHRHPQHPPCGARRSQRNGRIGVGGVGGASGVDDAVGLGHGVTLRGGLGTLVPHPTVPRRMPRRCRMPRR